MAIWWWVGFTSMVTIQSISSNVPTALKHNSIHTCKISTITKCIKFIVIVGFCNSSEPSHCMWSSLLVSVKLHIYSFNSLNVSCNRSVCMAPFRDKCLKYFPWCKCRWLDRSLGSLGFAFSISWCIRTELKYKSKINKYNLQETWPIKTCKLWAKIKTSLSEFRGFASRCFKILFVLGLPSKFPKPKHKNSYVLQSHWIRQRPPTITLTQMLQFCIYA